MKRGRKLSGLLLATALTIVLAGAVAGSVSADGADPGVAARVSVSSSPASEQGNDLSASPSVSADGRYVAFESLADNLVAGDTNEARDIFVRDRETGETTRVSVNSAGEQAERADEAWLESSEPSISADGRYVAFKSLADNLVAGDTNMAADIFVHDRQTGETTRVSVSSEGEEALDRLSWGSGNPSISADGRFVAFDSWADNLVPGDTNEGLDVFRHDRQTGETVRASVNSAGEQADDQSGHEASDSYNPSISADGRRVAFMSFATNLAPHDTNGEFDVFVRDLETSQTTRVSVSSSGRQGDSESGAPAISAGGRYVAFESLAATLVRGDTNDRWDVFVHDRDTDKTTRVSVDSTGGEGNKDSFGPSISADGRLVAFDSYSPKLMVGDTNKARDVFVRDRIAGTTTRVSMDSTGVQGNNDSFGASLSADGRYVAFASLATGLVADDTNATQDIFGYGPLGVTTVALQTTSNTSLAYGAKFIISGVVEAGQAVAGTQTVLQVSTGRDGGRFTPFRDAKKTTTGASGAFSFTVKPDCRTRYRVRFLGGAGYLASKSALVTCIPKVSLSAPAAAATAKKGKAFTVSTTLRPRHSMGDRPVRIYKYQKVGSRWVVRGYVSASVHNYGNYTRCKASLKIGTRGVWRLRAYLPRSDLHAATWSAGYDTVRVK